MSERRRPAGLGKSGSLPAEESAGEAHVYELANDATELDEIRAIFVAAELSLLDHEEQGRALAMFNGVVHECDRLGRCVEETAGAEAVLQCREFYQIYGDALLRIGMIEFEKQAADSCERDRMVVDAYAKEAQQIYEAGMQQPGAFSGLDFGVAMAELFLALCHDGGKDELARLLALGAAADEDLLLKIVHALMFGLQLAEQQTKLDVAETGMQLLQPRHGSLSTEMIAFYIQFMQTKVEVEMEMEMEDEEAGSGCDAQALLQVLKVCEELIAAQLEAAECKLPFLNLSAQNHLLYGCVYGLDEETAAEEERHYRKCRRIHAQMQQEHAIPMPEYIASLVRDSP